MGKEGHKFFDNDAYSLLQYFRKVDVNVIVKLYV